MWRVTFYVPKISFPIDQFHRLRRYALNGAHYFVKIFMNENRVGLTIQFFIQSNVS